MLNKKSILCIGLIFFFSGLQSIAFAEMKLAWDASEGEVIGYRIYYRTAQATYSTYKDVGNVMEYPISGLPLQENNLYFFIAKAYNNAGESGSSNEVSWKVLDRTSPAPVQGVTVNK
jgi:hypothetical protein